MIWFASLLTLVHSKITIIISDKCISVMPEHIPGSSNRFIELSSTETNFVASSSLFIAGRQRRVTEIMLYKRSWIRDYYLEPLQRMTSEFLYLKMKGDEQINFGRGPPTNYIFCGRINNCIISLRHLQI